MKKEKKTTTLKTWLFEKPAIFALWSFGTMLVAGLFCALITYIFGINQMHLPLIIMLAEIAVIIFPVYKLISGMPRDNMDRYSFVAIDTGISIIYYLMGMLFVLLLIFTGPALMYHIMMLQATSTILFLLSVILACLLCLYFIGVAIIGFYALYMRAREMGVSKNKILMTLPFSTHMFWAPSYLLSEDTKTKKSVVIKSAGFTKVVSWIVAKPVNAIFVFLIILMISASFFSVQKMLLTLFFASIFGVWIAITGTAKFRKNIGGAFSNTAIALNIIGILALVYIIAFAPPATKTVNVNIGNTQITETFIKE